MVPQGRDAAARRQRPGAGRGQQLRRREQARRRDRLSAAAGRGQAHRRRGLPAHRRAAGARREAPGGDRRLSRGDQAAAEMARALPPARARCWSARATRPARSRSTRPATRRCRTRSGLLLDQGSAHVVAGQIDDAMRSFERVLERDPKNEVAANNVAALIADYKYQDPQAARARAGAGRPVPRQRERLLPRHAGLAAVPQGRLPGGGGVPAAGAGAERLRAAVQLPSGHGALPRRAEGEGAGGAGAGLPRGCRLSGHRRGAGDPCQAAGRAGQDARRVRAPAEPACPAPVAAVGLALLLGGAGGVAARLAVECGRPGADRRRRPVQRRAGRACPGADRGPLRRRRSGLAADARWIGCGSSWAGASMR